MRRAASGSGRHDDDVTPDARDLEPLADLVAGGGVVALTGAGISTESGIPDYRGPSGASLRRHSPMTYQLFTGDPVARRRYWARSHVGWRIMREAQPNDGHRAVADLERLGLVLGTITQNVDGLHQAAGARRVVDLHGRLDRVVCLDCGTAMTRAHLDARLSAVNLDWRATVTAVNPDGDVDLPDDQLDAFTVVDCEACGGVLKPDVVYFGENVPAARLAEAYELADGARVLLVLGTSLTVFSGRRFVVRAEKAGVPVAIVNDGPTRGDDIAVVRLGTPLGVTLRGLVESLSTSTV
jgi:NAD-dependent SIR2 family protein deacetylase